MRSCYSSEWQLFRDSTRRTRGRYYFNDAPFYAGVTNLGSRDWHDKNWQASVLLGEVTEVPHRYFSGDGPAADIVPRVIGNADCLAEGEDEDNGVSGDQLVDGFVPRCTTDDAWARASSYTQCPTRRVYAALIVQLYAFDDDAIRRTVADWLGPVLHDDEYTVVIRHHAGVMPGIITITTADWQAFILDGTSNFQEIALQAFYFAFPPLNFGTIGTTGLWYQASTYVLNALVEDGLTPAHRLMCVGHSYGGAAAQCVAARLRWADAERDIKFLTFGSPKIGNVSFVNLVSACEGWNIADVDDPIPLLPPDAREFVPLLPLIAWPLMTNWGFWKRPPNQVFMNAEGILFERENFFLDTQTLLSMAQAAFEFQTIAAFAAHSSLEYLRRTQRRCPEQEWPLDQVASQVTWVPESALTLTRKPNPPRNGSLVFS